MSTLEYIKNKYNLDFNQESPIEIEGVGRLDLLRWFKELDFKVGVEVGVERGVYSHMICEVNEQVKLYGVDPYEKYEGYSEYHNQAEMDGIWDAMHERLKNLIKEGQFIPIRKRSMDALADFDDESLDFVYIDANHEGKYPYEDLKGWASKVRKGGIIAGHDYVRVRVWNFSVKDAVENYTKENNIHPWFVLGAYGKKPGVVRDRTRSWMIIKE